MSFLDDVGFLQVSQGNGSHDAFHMVGNLCQVSNPWSAWSARFEERKGCLTDLGSYHTAGRQCGAC